MTVYYPLFVLVFGFVFAIVLQAWFVRRASRLSSLLHDAKETHQALTQEVAQLNEEVAGFSRGMEANDASIAALEREIETLRHQIAEFAEEHGMKAPEMASKGGKGEAGRKDMKSRGDTSQEDTSQDTAAKGAASKGAASKGAGESA